MKAFVLILAVADYANGHDRLVSWVHKCKNEVTASCCDLVQSPASLKNEHLRVPVFDETISPNMAFTGAANVPLVLLSDLGDKGRGGVWDATSDECIDGSVGCGTGWPSECLMWSSPSPCFRYEQYSTSFPGFAMSRCEGESYKKFSINIVGSLLYWDGSQMVPTKNGERMKIYAQEWPNPGDLMHPLNENMSPKWSAVQGASIISPTSRSETITGKTQPSESIEWTAAGLSKSGTPLVFDSTFTRDLDTAQNDYWQKEDKGFERWGDQFFFTYTLVDSYGSPCDSTKCAAGTFQLKMTLEVDGRTSNEISVLFASGLQDGFNSKSTQEAHAYLVAQNQQSMGKQIEKLENDLKKADMVMKQNQIALTERVEKLEDGVISNDRFFAKEDNTENMVQSLQTEMGTLSNPTDKIGMIALIVGSTSLAVTLILSMFVICRRREVSKGPIRDEKPNSDFGTEKEMSMI